MKLKIIGHIDSFVGFAEKGAKEGELVYIRTQGSYFSKSDLNNPDILSIKNQISSIMASYIFPLFLHHFSSKELPKNFGLDSVRIELFADNSKNTITFNEDTKIFGEFELAKPKKFEYGDIVYQKDIQNVHSLYVKDRDPNSALMLFTSINGEWYGIIDLVYNRKNASEKHDIAQEYLESAKINFKNSKFKPFYNDLWTAYELLAESALLLHTALKLREPHKKIALLFKGFCENKNLSYYDDFKQIESIRTSARYGPPYENKPDMEENALKYLTSLEKFSKDTQKFLKERQVPIQNVESVDLQPSEIQKSK